MRGALWVIGCCLAKLSSRRSRVLLPRPVTLAVRSACTAPPPRARAWADLGQPKKNFGVLFCNAQQCLGRPTRLAASLFPILNSPKTHPHKAREGRLREVKLRSDA